jgi:SAM-dependent methyltransferase
MSSKLLLLGVSDPGDLIPLAAYLPKAQIVAMDASAACLEAAKKHVEALGLTNVSLVERELTSELVDLGPFDFILVRDAISRMAEEERAKLLAACANVLGNEGLLALGYPALPGWGPVGDLCAWLRDHVSSDASVEKKIMQVRSMIEPLRRQEEDSSGLAHTGLATLAEAIANMDDREIADVVLDAAVTGLRLRSVVKEASAAGLQYIGDSWRHLTYIQVLQELASAIGNRSSSLHDIEALAELAFPPARRCSVFSPHEPRSDEMAPFVELEVRLAASRLHPEKGELDLQADTEIFIGPEGARVEIQSLLLRTTLALLSKIWPNAVSVLSVLNQAGNALANASPQSAMKISEEEVKEVKERLLHLSELGLVDLRTEQLPLASDIDEKPRIHDLVQYQAAQGRWVTSPLHLDVELGPFLHALVRTLDGARGSGDVEVEMASAHEQGQFEIEVDGERPRDETQKKFVLRGQIMQGLRQLQDLGLLARRRDDDDPR